MTLFWVYAALLTAVALAFLVTPLLRGRGKGAAAASRAASNLTIIRDQLTELDEDLAAGTIDWEQWKVARGDLQRGLLEDAGAAGSCSVRAGQALQGGGLSCWRSRCRSLRCRSTWP